MLLSFLFRGADTISVTWSTSSMVDVSSINSRTLNIMVRQGSEGVFTCHAGSHSRSATLSIIGDYYN